MTRLSARTVQQFRQKERDKDAKKVEKESSDRSGSSGRSCGYRNRFSIYHRPKHMKAVLRSLIRIRENHTKFC